MEDEAFVTESTRFFVDTTVVFCLSWSSSVLSTLSDAGAEVLAVSSAGLFERVVKSVGFESLVPA